MPRPLCIHFCQSTGPTPKDDFHSINLVFEEALKANKILDWLKTKCRYKINHEYFGGSDVTIVSLNLEVLGIRIRCKV